MGNTERKRKPKLPRKRKKACIKAQGRASYYPMYGLYKFKQGFGGEIFQQLGCWDYPIEDDKYRYLTAREMSMQGYYV